MSLKTDFSLNSIKKIQFSKTESRQLEKLENNIRTYCFGKFFGEGWWVLAWTRIHTMFTVSKLYCNIS